jgi:DNA-binding XRE family transcriptional regulator
MHAQLSNSLLPLPATIHSIALPTLRRDSKPSSHLGARTFQGTFAQTSSQASPAVLPRDISSRFGLRLREMRRSKNLTQLQMAVDFGIDRSFISDVERGRKSISLTFLEVIALGLNVKLSELLQDL